MKKNVLLVLSVLCAVSCGQGNLDMLGMFWTLSETPDQRFSQSQEYNKANGFKTINVATDNYKLYVMADVHVDFSTKNLDQFVSDYMSDAGAAPFCLCLGDVINAVGHYPDFMDGMAPILSDASRTFFCTPGNHDIYYNQWQLYWDNLKTASYHFDVVTPGGFKDYFLCMDSASGTMGSKQIAWARECLEAASKAGYRHIFVFTHTHFFKTDYSQGHTSNYPLEESHELTSMFSQYGVSLVLTGHDHSRQVVNYKNVRYLVLDALEDHFVNAFYVTLQIGGHLSWDYIPVGVQDPSVRTSSRIENYE